MRNNLQTANEGVQERSTQFKPVEGGQETTPAGTFLVAAYALMWLFVVVFVVLTWRKTRAAQEQINRLEKAIAKLPDAG